MKTIQLPKHGDPEEAAAIAVDFLLNGGVVVMPTDTSYCLAADATNASGVAAVRALKGRDTAQPFSVIVASREQAEATTRFSEEAAKLWAAFMPGPLTLVLPLAEGIQLADGVAAGEADSAELTVGLRHPDNSFDTLVAERLERPYTATSANRSGELPAYSVSEFLDSLPDDLAPHCVIDAGTVPMVPVSTVVSVVDQVTILREGAISRDRIAGVVEVA